MSQRPLDPKKRAAVVKLLRQKPKKDTKPLTYKNIATQCDVSLGTVSHIAEVEGIRKEREEKAKQKTSKILNEVRNGGSYESVAERAGVSPSCARAQARRAKKKKLEQFDNTDDSFPDPISKIFTPFSIVDAGQHLIISDVHVPSHDRKTIELAVANGRANAVKSVILNGDFLDCHDLSDHDKDPSAPRYNEEIAMGRQLLRWLRKQLPKATIYFKHGNHEERFARYVYGRAPALFDLEFVNIASLLHFDDLGIIEIKDKRPIHLGKLPLLHGHEYKGGGGVYPARWLFNKSHSSGMCGHFHRTSESHHRDLKQRPAATWTIGCACLLTPAWLPLNEWNNGFALVDVSKNGEFSVQNLRVIDGKIY
jgi:predicted phosphodiesterase